MEVGLCTVGTLLEWKFVSKVGGLFERECIFVGLGRYPRGVKDLGICGYQTLFLTRTGFSRSSDRDQIRGFIGTETDNSTKGTKKGGRNECY